MNNLSIFVRIDRLLSLGVWKVMMTSELNSYAFRWALQKELNPAQEPYTYNTWYNFMKKSNFTSQNDIETTYYQSLAKN